MLRKFIHLINNRSAILYISILMKTFNYSWLSDPTEMQLHNKWLQNAKITRLNLASQFNNKIIQKTTVWHTSQYTDFTLKNLFFSSNIKAV